MTTARRTVYLVLLLTLLLLTPLAEASWRGRRGGWVTIGAPVTCAQVEPVPDPRQVLDAQVAAWNRGDLEGFMAGYWQSPELTFFSGDKTTQGWQATLDRYRARYQGEGREMGKLTFSDVAVEPLGVDSALVRGRWQVVKSKETAAGLFTLLFKRFPEGWRIVHDHTSAG